MAGHRGSAARLQGLLWVFLVALALPVQAQDDGPADPDGDGVPNEADSCRDVANARQEDLDGDGVGNECDPDLDGDGAANVEDDCAFVADPEQVDSDLDGAGDPCDPDQDGDGIPDAEDDCPTLGSDVRVDAACRPMPPPRARAPLPLADTAKPLGAAAAVTTVAAHPAIGLATGVQAAFVVFAAVATVRRQP